ncbi:hypothetical protein F5884DRAFT_792878 [Xylogone sp. PMI_703]|nr:hypothetical protein F5884DRAFT_792878 [Xylogone sp. PMI_703]
MADAMCGPSNALQNFQKHTTTDRTLQQERLISRPGPSQGFRSTAGQNVGVLDPEFEAFQAGQLPLDPGFQPHAFSPAPQHVHQPPPANWASDFQRLNISNTPSPVPQQPFMQQHPQQKQNLGGWHQEFALHQSQMTNPATAQASAPQYTHSYQFPMMSNMAGPANFTGAYAGGHQDQVPAEAQQTEMFDEEAFARAFEEASKMEEHMKEELEQQQAEQQLDELVVKEQTETGVEAEPHEQIRIGADLIHDPRDQRQQDRQEQEDPDALARTAGQLLNSVRDNQSEKFKNSAFLELMRQLRDREVRVEGDQIVSTDTSAENEAIKEEIIELSRQLKKLALDRDRPPNARNSGLHYRQVYAILTKLDKLHTSMTKDVIDSTRIIRVLNAMRNQPALKDVDPLLNQIDLTLSNLQKISEQEATQPHDWSVNETRSANGEITHVNEDPLTLEEYFSLQEEFVRSGYSAFRNLLLVERLLGYRISADMNQQPHEIHLDRLRSILGKNIVALMDLCVDRGLSADQIPDLSLSTLVRAARMHGIDSPEFKHVLREVENDVEDHRRQLIRSGFFPQS